MKESLNEVMADKVPKMQKKQHKKWMTEEILNLMEDRRKSKSNIDLYKILNTQIKDKCNEAKEQWINEQCKEIENNLTVDSKYMHSKIKDIKGTKGCTASDCVKAKDGNLLMEREDVLNRWSEYIEDLFQDDRSEKPIIKKDMDGRPILKEEVSAAIRKMKHGKAVGPDNIPIEVFAVLEDIGIDFLTKLLNSIYDSGKIPEDLAKSVFITLPKIPGTIWHRGKLPFKILNFAKFCQKKGKILPQKIDKFAIFCHKNCQMAQIKFTDQRMFFSFPEA